MRKLAASKGVMGTVVQGGVGGAAYFVGAKAGANIKMLQGRWWAMPTALLVGGHLVKRWSPESGAAVCGAAGALMAMSYWVNQPGSLGPPANPASGVFQGEAGAYGGIQPGDAGALMLGSGPASRYTRRSEAGALIT